MIDLALVRLFHNTDFNVMDNITIYCLAFSFKSLIQRLTNLVVDAYSAASRTKETSNLEIRNVRHLYVVFHENVDYFGLDWN